MEFGSICQKTGDRCFSSLCYDERKCQLSQQVRPIPKEAPEPAPKKPERVFHFYMSHYDKEVQEMLVRNGHRISLKEDDDWEIALFPGGPDIVPLLYGEKMLEETHCNLNRDLQEITLFKKLHKKRLKVGICRGAQLLNVLSGGRLWQDANFHHCQEGHLVYVDDWIVQKNPMMMSSRHHQMMIPASDAWVIGSAKRSTRKKNDYYGECIWTPDQISKEAPNDPEIVFYSSTNSICFQPHPEDKGVPNCTELFFEIIENLFTDAEHEEAMKGF